MKMYNYSRHNVESKDIDAISEVMQSDFLSQGPKLRQFEQKVAKYCQAKYCLAVCNGTAALHLACLALGVGESKDDTGWTSPLSFVASANCIRYCGAKPDFIDIHPCTFNMDTDLLEQALEKSSEKGTLPKVLIPVHFAGLSCNMRRIWTLAQKYGVHVIEDACHALGGSYLEKPIGCCDFSDIAVFSLHPVKSITTGEGGLILTNNKELFEKMQSMRSHGLVKNTSLTPNFPPYHVEMTTEGFNYKITDMQCAMGISQMDRLDEYIYKRRILAKHYRKRLGNKGGISLQKCEQGFDSSAWHLMIATFDFHRKIIDKTDFFYRLQKEGINLMVHYYPIHLHRFYERLGYSKGLFPNSEAYYNKSFSLPLHPSLETEDVDRVCDIIIDNFR